MATELLSADNDSETSDSALTTNAANQSFTVYLKGESGAEDVPAAAYIWLQVQSDEGGWINMIRLNSQHQPFFICDGVGTFRLTRPAQKYIIGAFKG